METARSRFLRYVTYYTTSDEHTGASPSTERQKDLGRVLLAELAALGLTAGRMDSAGNVIATLPASPGVTAPVVALIAHMDTAPAAPGENVKPRVVRYEGGDLPLSDTVSLTEAPPCWAPTTRPASPRAWPPWSCCKAVPTVRFGWCSPPTRRSAAA